MYDQQQNSDPGDQHVQLYECHWILYFFCIFEDQSSGGLVNPDGNGEAEISNVIFDTQNDSTETHDDNQLLNMSWRGQQVQPYESRVNPDIVHHVEGRNSSEFVRKLRS